MACWDMRFQLPISSHCHPSRARIRRLSMHPLYQSWVIAGKVQGSRSDWEITLCVVAETLALRVFSSHMNQVLDSFHMKAAHHYF